MKTSTAVLLLASSSAYAVSLDYNDPDSIRSAAAAIAYGLMSDYNGNRSGQIPGVFDLHDTVEDHFWIGSPWDAMLDYSYLTGDTTYDEVVKQALLWQVGSNDDYRPANWSAYLSNEQQSNWALAAMTAAENNFSAPSANMSWAKIAQNVFDEQVELWDDKTCKGGLRWELYPYQSGYDYKDGMSNTQFFNLAARLAHLSQATGQSNDTFTKWAEKSYNWMTSSGLIDGDYRVFAGFSTSEGCQDVNQIRWSTNAGSAAYGAALMANVTDSDEWRTRAVKLVLQIFDVFFDSDEIVTESACAQGTCTEDALFYKGDLGRDLARILVVMPANDFYANIPERMQKSAQAAAETGCKNASNCTSIWGSKGKNPPATVNELGSQYSALQFVQQLLAFNANGTPVVHNTTGTSSSANSGGSSPSSNTSGGASASPTGAAASLTMSRWSLGGLVAAGLFAFMLL